MKNEAQNTVGSQRVNENKVPSILVSNVEKYDHERDKKQVKFHKAQIPQPSPLTSRKQGPEATSGTKLSPSIIPPKRAQRLIKRTTSWSEVSTENAKSFGKTIKELEIMKTNAQNKSKSKGTIMINKPQKVRRNSLQTHPLTTGEKQVKDVVPCM